MRITTITPVLQPLAVRLGVNEFSPAYRQLIDTILANSPELHRGDWADKRKKTGLVVGGDIDEHTFYSDIHRDDVDIRLFFWRGKLGSGYPVTVHFFNNHLAVFEIDFPKPENIEDREVGPWFEQLTKELVDEFAEKVFAPIIRRLFNLELDNLEIDHRQSKTFHRLWVGTTLRLTEPELHIPDNQRLIEDWLAATIRPADAEDIIGGKSRHSLRWLNYVMVETAVDSDHYKLEAMILAQYFYSVQHKFNESLFHEISEVFIERDPKATEKNLKRLRAQTQLHISSYYESRNYLVRRKNKLLGDILAEWDFDNMLENADRMITTCSTRLDEILATKRSRATLVTDLILASIGFFAIFELALQFVGYSREWVTNPVLAYEDSGRSAFFSWVAGWEVDNVLLGSFVLFALLALAYGYVKKD